MKYRELEWILVDEISMVSNDFWKYVHLHLQEIKQCKEPFGGVNIIAIGDMYQLQPVKANYVFMDLRHNYGPLATNLWCEYITMYELDEIMQQKHDRQFAELLNGFCIGEHTSADLNLLATWSITAEEAKSLNHAPHFFPARQKVDQYNDNVLHNSTCEKSLLQLSTFHQVAVHQNSSNNCKQLLINVNLKVQVAYQK